MTRNLSFGKTCPFAQFKNLKLEPGMANRKNCNAKHDNIANPPKKYRNKK